MAALGAPIDFFQGPLGNIRPGLLLCPSAKKKLQGLNGEQIHIDVFFRFRLNSLIGAIPVQITEINTTT